MESSTLTGRWILVYKHGFFDKCMGFLQATGMTCFTMLFAGYILFVIASISGIRGLPQPSWNTAEDDTFANKALHLFFLLAGGWLARDNLRNLAKIMKDIFTRNRNYEGVLKTVEKKNYSGLRINYQMLALECADATWEITPRLKLGYLLRPGKKIRIFFTGGTRTIKRLWISD